MRIFDAAEGESDARIVLTAWRMGNDIVLAIYNDPAHIGAVALGEYDCAERRASASVITRRGHRDDLIAQKAAREIAKAGCTSVCAIVGVHVPKANAQTIEGLVRNSEHLIHALCSQLACVACRPKTGPR